MRTDWIDIRPWTTTAGAVAIAVSVLLLIVGGCSQDGQVASPGFGAGFAPAGQGREALITHDGGMSITATKDLASVDVALRITSVGRVRRVTLILDGARIGSGTIVPGHEITVTGHGGPLTVGGHGLHVVVSPRGAASSTAPRAIVADPIGVTAVEAG